MNIQEQILAGKIFIYPTDTIYGLGCDATNASAVSKIKEIKSRDKNKPLSVIAPNLDWIEENFIIDCNLKKYLPGPYTIILKKKNKDFLPEVSPTETIGIRIPNNDFTKEIQKSAVPFVTTSVNLSGESFATSIDETKEEIKNQIDIIIDVGKLNGRPSTLVINGEEIKR
jgi:L-threonylcarbamoyladenylate synthase